MMGKSDIDPSDIGKHPKVIKVAQNDMAETDVLVCGKCHGVFHFIELFQDHKDHGCERDSEFRDCRESKEKVWAFLLWKAAQLNSNVENNSINTTNSWKLYQTWVKLEESVRETWIVAGKTIQSFAKMGQGSLQEMPVKITKTVVDSTPRAMSAPKPTPKVIDNKPIFRREVNTDNEDDISPNRVIRRPVNQQLNQSKTPPAPTNTVLNKSLNRRANRTVPNTNGQEIEEETVEKIIAKRFNPRRKMHEYLVKWEGFPHDQNTWEPQTHLESCPQLLDTFEKQLARQKEQRAAQAVKQAATPTPPQPQPQVALPVKSVEVSPLSPTSRLPRNSKARAMDQVKQWCSQEDLNTSSGTGNKRKLDDSDFDESGTTEDGMDPDENGLQATKRLRNGNAILKVDSSGDIKISQLPATTTITKTVNGNVKTSGNEPSAEVIITKDNQSSGIVKKAGALSMGTQKTEAQIRFLSKGENTSSGIVRINKLASGVITAGQTRITQISNQRGGAVQQQQQRAVSNSSAPSPRNAISSVAGQTRIVQRTTISPSSNQQQQQQQATKAIINRVTKPAVEQPKTITPEQKIAQLSQKYDLKVTRKVVHTPTPQMPPQQQQQRQQVQKMPAVNDLPDDPFPEPQSPPRPLTLCPVTGKVLGQAEGEPSPLPSPDPTKKSNETTSQPTVGILQTNAAAAAEEMSEGLALTASGEEGQTHQILTNEDGTPLLVTGEDGTIYQVAGKNAEGQTILIAQGADGEQQFAYVAAEEGDEGGMLTLDNAVAEAVAQMLPEQQAEALAAAAAAAGGEAQFILKQEGGDDTAATEGLTIQTGDAGDSQDGNIPAEVVQADLPSPGGTRRVVLLLQDGTFMMTEMHDDEYQALNIVT